MFKRFFQKKNSGSLSKVEYWKKWELFELFEDLRNAEKVLTEIANDITDEEFVKFKCSFTEHLSEIEGENIADFTRIRKWFTPKKEWETFCSEKELGNNIFRITDKWKRNQDFIQGTKVFLNNEFGVVLDKTFENEIYGLIRWDTNKENDVEDWRGLFASFLQSGGKIIGQEYKFQFINDDGTFKES